MMRTPPGQKGKKPERESEAGAEDPHQGGQHSPPQDDAGAIEKTPTGTQGQIDQQMLVKGILEQMAPTLSAMMKKELEPFGSQINALSRRMDSVEQSRSQSRASVRKREDHGASGGNQPTFQSKSQIEQANLDYIDNKLLGEASAATNTNHPDEQVDPPTNQQGHLEEDNTRARDPLKPRSDPVLIHTSPTRHPRLQTKLETLNEEVCKEPETTDSHGLRGNPKDPADQFDRHDFAHQHPHHTADGNHLVGTHARDLQSPFDPRQQSQAQSHPYQTSRHVAAPPQQAPVQLVLPPELLHLMNSRDEVRINVNDLPKFTGYQDPEGIEVFVRCIDLYLHSNRVKPEKIVAQLGALLKDGAHKWWKGIGDPELAALGDDWEKWKAKLLKAFRGAKTPAFNQRAMMHRVLMRGEDVRDYFNDKKALILRCMPQTPDDVIGTMIMGGVPAVWQSALRWKPGENTLDELFETMELQSHQLSSCWWRADVDFRDTNGRPLPAFYDGITNVGENTSALAPPVIKKEGSQQQVGNNEAQVYLSTSTPNTSPRRFTTDPNDPANKAWAASQAAFLGRPPSRPYPPPYACRACDKNLYHWHPDCKTVMEREQARLNQANKTGSGQDNFRPQNHYQAPQTSA